MSSITDAIRLQDVERVKRILTEVPSAIDERDERGIPAALLAAATGNLELVRYIVEYSRASMNLVDARNRNILHYAATSGEVSLCRYLVEKVGMDILGGDFDMVTPYQIAVKSGARELEAYFQMVVGSAYEEMYHNPIRRGMFPDPSIVRVGEDYYMVNSSFIYFPCIPVSHSRDLIHWEIIGHAITNPEWSRLGGLEGGRGYWAPDISYAGGRFYITATYRMNDTGPVYRRQIIVSSERPEGPYSEPVFIEEDGIDPSLFHEEDGRHYMLLNRGARILELDSECRKQISEAKLLYYGDQKRAPEGPHLLKKDGWYYLFLAEGGTGSGHRISVARSRELFGNYKPCPYNPIMHQWDEGAGIWRCGHGKPVSTPDGDWYMVYLCSRKFPGNAGKGPAICSILGRETAIDPIEWTPDGWPIVNGGKGPSVLQRAPKLPRFVPEDDSDQQWLTPREPERDGIVIETAQRAGSEEKADSYKAGKRGGRIRLRASRAPLSSVLARNICLRRQTSFGYTAGVKMLLPRLSDGQEAGLVCYYDENSWVSYAVCADENGYFLQLKEHIGTDTTEYPKKYAAPGITEVYLSVRTMGLERQFFAESAAGSFESEKLDDVYYLCDEGVSMGKRFTGAMIGMYAYSKERELTVDFGDFVYEELS